MNILIADDDLASRRLLDVTLKRRGYSVLVTADGLGAWNQLQAPESPSLAIPDWLMPGLDGVELCRRLRAVPRQRPLYIILLTGYSRKQDIATGLQAGADDYIVKPFDRDELNARVQVGMRLVQLQETLADRVQELEVALSRVKVLHGLLPMCSYCKNVRDDQNYWQQVEDYMAAYADVRFSHGICPDCYKKVIEPQLAAAGIDPENTDWPQG
jgi:DNA-binding response OmpR family regulator